MHGRLRGADFKCTDQVRRTAVPLRKNSTLQDLQQLPVTDNNTRLALPRITARRRKLTQAGAAHRSPMEAGAEAEPLNPSI